MRIVEVRDEAGLLRLKGAWAELLSHSPSDTIFLSWEWVSAWWGSYGTAGGLEILLAVDEENAVRGIAPLRRQNVRKYGLEFSALSFIGDGSSDSDYLDFIIGSDDEGPVMEAFVKHLEKELSRGTLLDLNEIPACSRNLPFLQALRQRYGMLGRETDVACATVPLPGDWQGYLRVLAPRFRTKVRSVLRHLETNPDLRFHFCDQPEQLNRLLPSLFELHRRRWAKEAKPGVFHWDRKRRFYETLSPLLLDRGWLSFSWLEWRGQILACQYGFTYRNRYFQLQEGYDPTCEHWNVGIGLRAWSIRELLKRGVEEYDFLAGVGRHKSDWGATIKTSKRIVLSGRQDEDILFCRAPEWVFQARRRLKQYLPDRLLRAFDARQERRRIASFEQSTASWPTRDVVRGALAGCYAYSPLPWLLSPLRDGYQLRVSPNGRLPRIQIQKRRQPSVRILYFHRINDEGDPFFPAMPTAVFERQMRFLARHYRVVSLSEAARRLSEGAPPVSVVGLTFDDGYQDNYLNAFPILERYGLPATIFLTTGAIDGRELLWFEELALALKRTSQTHIDLEIDIPRRLRLGTEAERLHANGQIHTILRNLPDRERRRWLAEILALLGRCDPRSERMLTWDQIRIMKQRRIDFGGHTVTHPFVSRLLPTQATWEVSECKKRIEDELQTPVEHFAYPHGREVDFAAWNKQVIQEAGYRTAVSTLWGINYPTTDRMALRRGGPWEERAALFGAKLDWYQWTDV